MTKTIKENWCEFIPPQKNTDIFFEDLYAKFEIQITKQREEIKILREALEKFKICFESFSVKVEGLPAQVCWGQAIELAKSALEQTKGTL